MIIPIHSLGLAPVLMCFDGFHMFLLLMIDGEWSGDWDETHGVL